VGKGREMKFVLDRRLVVFCTQRLPLERGEEEGKKGQGKREEKEKEEE
jgi:hypothetical protein